jgi:YggT family protein
MFVIGNLIAAVADVLNLLLTTYTWIIIARALISWVSPDPYNPIVQFLYRITEPVLAPVRRRLPGYGMGLDLSPLIVIIAIMFLRRFLVASLHQLAMNMQ